MGTPFIIKVDTTLGGFPDNQFDLILFNDGYNFNIDWDYANPETDIQHNPTSGISWDASVLSHTYSSGGVKLIAITENVEGGFPRIYFNELGDSIKLLEITQWGENKWVSMNRAFFGCTNLQITATDHATANTGSVTDFYLAFSNCTGLTTFPLINTSSGTDFSSAWAGCTGLTTFPLINTSSGTNFSSAWSGCTGLNGFDFPLINLRNISSGKGYAYCFPDVMLSPKSYSALLNDLAANAVSNNISFNGGTSRYTKAGDISRTSLIALKSWAITDGNTTDICDITALTATELNPQNLAISVTCDEDSTLYFVVLPKGDKRPTSDQVYAGTNGLDVPVPVGYSGSGPAMAGVAVTLSPSGLKSQTSYDMYIVAEQP